MHTTLGRRMSVITLQLKIRTEKGKQAFQQTGPKAWNELPDLNRSSQSTESFQEKNKKNYFR